MLGQQTPAPQAPQAPQAPAPPASTPVAVQNAAMHARILDLQTRVNVLEAQRPVLMERVQGPDGPLRVQAEQALLDVDVNLASARAELSVLQGQTGGPSAPFSGTSVPPGSQSWFDKIDPDAVTAVFVMTALAVLIPLSIGIARRLWRHPPKQSSPPLEDKIIPRLDRLEQAVDAIAIEVERISEGQRFVSRVLTERPPIVAPVSAQPASNVEAIGDAKPFLALGAGPLEPIRVAERQAVKQSVTPH